MPDLVDALRTAQATATQQSALANEVQQQIQVLAAEQRGIQTQMRQIEVRRDRLLADRSALVPPDMQQLAQMQTQLSTAKSDAAQAQEQLEQLQAALSRLDAERRVHSAASSAQLARLSDLKARLEALRTLQERVKTDGKLQPWLARHGLENLPKLWTRLHVQTGWEGAIEAALRERLSALEVSRLEIVSAFASEHGSNSAPPTRLAFYSTAHAPVVGSPATAHLTPLAQRLHIQDEALQAMLTDWLTGCYCASNLEEALAGREQLGPGETLYVSAGHAVSRHGVSFYAPDSEQAGMLARAQEIESLDKQVRAQSLVVDQTRDAQIKVDATYSETAEQLASVQRKVSGQLELAHTLQVDTLRLTQQSEQIHARSQMLADDLAEIENTAQELQERGVQCEGRFDELDLQLADIQERQVHDDDLVAQAQQRLAQAREQLRLVERGAQEAAFDCRSLAARRLELVRAIDTAAQQVQQISAERSGVQDELERFSDAAAQNGLHAAQATKLEREQELTAKRSACDDLATQIRLGDEQRLQLERRLEPLRGRITDLQLKEQAARLAAEQFTQQLEQAKADLENIAQSIVQGNVKVTGLQSEIDRLLRAIEALGAVNLAALQELTTARERKQFLDSQCGDLNQAIQTLQDAIRKIDGETRDLLANTFDAVNSHFGKMFPELFGGGQAKLVMTGAEILDAGVQVMAQPPGKKNQTIHLLSGGEKALTAIALVFAIFQLNPAPFCLLDEVDAPLDDANTERYTKLVASMSSETQFLFISHNKIAMEMAKQLIGVTMQEQGVSRIVAVDMESAVQMAEAA
jgi:chromosome segregation protein